MDIGNNQTGANTIKEHHNNKKR